MGQCVGSGSVVVCWDVSYLLVVRVFVSHLLTGHVGFYVVLCSTLYVYMCVCVCGGGGL